MVSGRSVADSSLTRVSAPAISAAEASAASASRSSAAGSGRMTISTPTKPTAVASPRRQRTTSPRIRIASTIMNSGRA
jgi:hypothetical protein